MAFLKAQYRRIVGVFLVIIGVIGLLIPFMPGWIFLLPGVHYLFGERFHKYKTYQRIESLWRRIKDFLPVIRKFNEK